MRSLQSKLITVRDALLTVTASCYHYRRPAEIEKNYIIWQEDSEEESFDADNRKREQQIHGTIDYFTQTEFDAVTDSIQNALDDAEVGFRLNSVDYEDDTKLIHYEWEFWVM